ncbi:MAG: transporter, family, macrolide efflux protein, partial [Fimbriimonadaceae bacterium]|nr:transporter, family, macrolide efflux protein [Fimbriimonadaceae bacterium]
MLSRELLRIRGFRDLWLGQAISQIGDSIYYVAFMFMAQKVTGSIAMVGYVGSMEMLTYLLVGPYAGVIADRNERKRIMLL